LWPRPWRNNLKLSALGTYLEDPFLNKLYTVIRNAGAIRSISLDITHACNLRCTGCYYFEEEMDKYVASDSEEAFEALLDSELNRGTNFITIVGGEPALVLHRIKKIYDRFKVNVATNGLIRIPYAGFENLPIGIAVWGNHETDAKLRNKGKRDLFSIALKNYRNDPRAFWYYTVAPGNADEIESVVETCIENGNKVLFNYYSDIGNRGGALDYRKGFDEVRQKIDHVIAKYPRHIFMTSWFNRVVTTGELMGEKWGYDVCTNLSENLAVNEERFKNGNPYNPHFRAYHADFKTTRRCCTGMQRDCDSCFDTWEHFSWVMINLRKHLASKQDFTSWLTTMYVFYLVNRIIDYDKEIDFLPKVHDAVSLARKMGEGRVLG
jgi:MoaA/NifB/PqqE/SkfB family radical SAM enzyme